MRGSHALAAVGLLMVTFGASGGAITRQPFASLPDFAVAPISAHGSGPSASQSAQVPPDLFESRVRPILANRCYRCHTDQESGGLRLDSREALLKGGESGAAIVPGDAEKSLLIRAVRHTMAGLKMPQDAAKLPDDEIDALAAWITGGAPWPATTAAATATPAVRRITPEQRAFWSFQPIGRPQVPVVRNAAWPKTDIDRFVLARLERDGLAPVAAADKRTLIRRATLDLTGLPPTPQEISDFENDGAPDAFAKVVDRLLASPAYGETWGRLWLDVARYGEDDYRSLDPKGRGFNPYPNAYLYRDWVIKAFNDDLPYNDFVRAQLAADLLDERVRVRMLPALGFLGLGPWYYDNGAVEITRADERHDRVDVVSRGFLGLTVGCARCHDHKYDPIPTRDYYGLSGVFLNTTYREYPLAPRAVVDAYNSEEKRIEKQEKLLAQYLQTESTQLAEALAFQSARYMQAAWRVTGEPKEELARVAEAQKLDYELLDRWVKFLAKPPRFYPFLAKWQEMIAAGGSAADAKSLAEAFQKLLVDVMIEKHDIKEENEIIAAKALPGTKKKQPAKLPSDFVTNDDFCPGCGLELKNLPVERSNLWTDVFQRDLQEGFDPAQPGAKMKPGLLAFRGWGLERQLSAAHRQYIDDMRAQIKAAKKAMPPSFAYVHGVADVEKPASLRLSVRGNPYNLGDEVPRHFLSVLSDGEPQALGTAGSGRLDLADAILKQPVAMRVIVNRIWKWHFGTGIVDTPSNFGMSGERPTNPELLEYLAQFFIDHKLSIKALHRELMLSAVYQLSAADSPKNADIDSGNRLYWRANRHRMTAEEIRDSVLFVSGALDSTMGGPSARLTPAYTRRTVYGRISRYRLDEYLQLFDFPSPNLSAERRFTTAVPLQRLFLMNSDFMQQQAEVLAKRIGSEPDNPSRIRQAYRLIFGRAPTDAELRAGLDYLAAEPMKAYEDRKAADASAAAKPVSREGDEKKDADDDDDDDEIAVPVSANGMMAGVLPGTPRDRADGKALPVTTTWGRYIRVLLSSNEFLFVD